MIWGQTLHSIWKRKEDKITLIMHASFILFYFLLRALHQMTVKNNHKGLLWMFLTVIINNVTSFFMIVKNCHNCSLSLLPRETCNSHKWWNCDYFVTVDYHNVETRDCCKQSYIGDYVEVYKLVTVHNSHKFVTE